MIPRQFCLVHHYPQNSSSLSVAMRNLRKRCRGLSPGATPPKLGDHTTLLPPFRAHPDEMRNFLMGLNISRALYGDDSKTEFLAETQGIHFFRNPESDACVVKILLPKNYHAMIAECRKELSRFNEWVFPIYGDDYHPHTCVLEGPGLYEDLYPHLAELENSVFIIRFRLPFPTIMVKVVESGVTHWEEFDPKK